MEQKTKDCPFEGFTPQEIDALKRAAAKEMSIDRAILLRNRAREIADTISKEVKEIEYSLPYIERPFTKAFVEGMRASLHVSSLSCEYHDVLAELTAIYELQKGGAR